MAAKVLIVDDHKLTRQVVRSLLGDNFIQVCGEAEDGKQAIEKVKLLKPDVVLLDISMPVMDGIQAPLRFAKSRPGQRFCFFRCTTVRNIERRRVYWA